MISEKNVSDALVYLAVGGSAEAEAGHLAAERARERREAEVFLSVAGSVRDREMRVRLDDEYQQLLADEHAAKVELTKAKAREKGADKICEIWRTLNANARAAERVR